MTLPVIRFLKSCSDEDRTFWRRVIVDHDQQDVDLERAVSMLRKSGALERPTSKEYSNGPTSYAVNQSRRYSRLLTPPMHKTS